MIALKVGTAVAKPGTLQFGSWPAWEYPTGGRESLPLIVARGRRDGPCVWLTAGIHGDEQAGPAVLYRLMSPELAASMRGTVVAVPALSPSALRCVRYQPDHLTENPNRLWPEHRPGKRDPEGGPPSSTEEVYGRLFDRIARSADYLIDYHNAWPRSLSFAFRDRIFYRGQDPDAGAQLQRAQELANAQDEMLRAYGHTVVGEFPAERCVEEGLQRSLSAAAMLVAGVPAVTVELGTGDRPDPAIVSAAVAGTRNVLRSVGVLDGAPEPITGIKKIEPETPVRRTRALRVDRACVLLHLVEAGDRVEAGEPVAEVRDAWGRPLGDGLLRSRHDGFVIGLPRGIYFFPGAPAAYLAIPDNAPRVVPYPPEPQRDPPSSHPGPSAPSGNQDGLAMPE